MGPVRYLITDGVPPRFVYWQATCMRLSSRWLREVVIK